MTEFEFHKDKDSWEEYVEHMELYFIVNKVTEEAMKVAILLTKCGAPTYKLIRELSTPVKPKDKKFEDIVALMTRHLNPKKNEALERGNFRLARQHAEESINEALRGIQLEAERSEDMNPQAREEQQEQVLENNSESATQAETQPQDSSKLETNDNMTEFEFHKDKDSWEEYVEHMKLYFIANKVTEDALKVAILLTKCGAPTYKLIRELSAPVKPTDKKFEDIVALMTGHLNPKKNEALERYNFRLARQNAGESINEFLARLKELSIHCEFGTKLNDNLRDQLVCGVADKATRIALLSESQLTYDEAVNIATTRESAVKNVAGTGEQQDQAAVKHLGPRRQHQGKTTDSSSGENNSGSNRSNNYQGSKCSENKSSSSHNNANANTRRERAAAPAPLLGSTNTVQSPFRGLSFGVPILPDSAHFARLSPIGGFGAGNQSSPFSQSPFDKPITTTTFGGAAAPVFSSPNNSLFGSKPAGATSGGLFGNTTTEPAFGQPPTSQPSFAGFSSPNTNTGLFGNQQNANTSLFGASNPTPAFTKQAKFFVEKQATKPAGSGFVGSTGTGLFGQAYTSGSGANNTTGGMSGTVVKFSPLTGSDTELKNGNTHSISTRHYCITCMKEYEGKSPEELRLEDYTAGRKGQSQGAQTSGLFGSPAQPSLFGNAGVNTSTANTGSGSAATGFGATSQPAATSGLFAKPMTGFGATATTSNAFPFSTANTGSGSAATGFGATSQPAATSGLFAKPMTGFGATATTSSAFPFNSTTTTFDPFGTNIQAEPFGAAAPAPLFGSTNTAQTPFRGLSFGGFGAGNQSSPFSQSPFGKPIATTNLGGAAAPVFGSPNNSLFGSKPAGGTSGGLFGNTTTAPAFGQPPTSQPSFAGFSSPNTNTGLFGSQQNANTSLFGASNPTPAFGQATKPAGFGFGGSTGTGLFGQAQQPAQQTNTTANTSLFGNTSGFTANNTAGGMTGTVVKFSPLTGSDTELKNGNTHSISTRHYCITCMKEYEGKSLEELRLEDYTAGRKGQSQAAQTSGLFGSPAQPSLFVRGRRRGRGALQGFRGAGNQNPEQNRPPGDEELRIVPIEQPQPEVRIETRNINDDLPLRDDNLEQVPLPENAVPVDRAELLPDEEGVNDDVLNPAGFCCICLTEPATHAFIPCGHFCCCANCAERILLRCPLCRDEYFGVYQIRANP